jgi:hypothetical protein
MTRSQQISYAHILEKARAANDKRSVRQKNLKALGDFVFRALCRRQYVSVVLIAEVFPVSALSGCG